MAITGNTTSAGPFGSGVGGGVASELGSLKVFDSVISRNRVPRPTGLISDTSGGGVAQAGGTAEITNTTVSANTAAGPRGSGGGIFDIAVAGPTTVKLTNTTVNGNGAATGANLESIGSAGTATIATKNSIVANPDRWGHQLRDRVWGDDHLERRKPRVPGHLLRLHRWPGQAESEPAARRARKQRRPDEHARLKAASPAIDAARSSGCPATDQRGVARPQDGDASGAAVCDMGAFELQPTPSPGGGGSGEPCTINRGDGNDVIRGTSGSDVICAGAGNDTVYGGGGNDEIRGAGGNDVLRGGEGNDRIEGGSGKDLANGGPGSDTCATDPRDQRTAC